MVAGWVIAMYELILYFLISHKIRKYYTELQNMNIVMYYWFTMTVLTMIWECSFVYQYKSINVFSQDLIDTDTHAWTNDYGLECILPWKTAFIFYGEYGAYADREYMIRTDDWSRVIESSHAIFCGVFSFLALYLKANNAFICRSREKFYLAVGVSMGSQMMNSVLYMANYFVQIHNKNNVNYCSIAFPCHLARSFMYVNVFWVVMPAEAIISTWCGWNKLRID
jgi:hypothetical protein